jgi:hypothetical protein
MKPQPVDEEEVEYEPADQIQMATTALRIFDILDESDIKGKNRSLKSLCSAKVRIEHYETLPGVILIVVANRML